MLERAAESGDYPPAEAELSQEATEECHLLRKIELNWDMVKGRFFHRQKNQVSGGG